MKRTTTAATTSVIALCLLLVCGCSSKPKTTDTASKVLGPNAAYILPEPTRVEGWNFQRPDGSVATDPPIRPLPLSVGRELGKLLLDENTYAKPARGGAFERAVGFRVWRGDQNVEVYLSFANDQMYIKYPGYTGQPTSNLIGVTNAREQLLAVTHKAFPEYKAPRVK